MVADENPGSSSARIPFLERFVDKKKEKKKTDERYQFSRGLVERIAHGVLEKIFRVRRVPRKIDPPGNCFSPEFLMQHRFLIRLLFLQF